MNFGNLTSDLTSFSTLVIRTFASMPNNTDYSKKENTTQSKIQSNNINFKETRRPQIVINEVPERQHTFQSHKILPGERTYSEATNPRLYNSHNITVFSDRIASFTRNIRSNFNNQLKEGRARFKYFPGATSSDLLFYIKLILLIQYY